MENKEEISQYEMMKLPEYKWSVHPFGMETVVIYNLINRPRLWNRIWMRLIFGWRFEPI